MNTKFIQYRAAATFGRAQIKHYTASKRLSQKGLCISILIDLLCWHACREGLPFRTPGTVPPFWDLLVLQLLRPDSSNLPCLYSTFHLEYPLVLFRICFLHFHLESWTIAHLFPTRGKTLVFILKILNILLRFHVNLDTESDTMAHNKHILKAFCTGLFMHFLLTTHNSLHPINILLSHQVLERFSTSSPIR